MTSRVSSYLTSWIMFRPSGKNPQPRIQAGEKRPKAHPAFGKAATISCPQCLRNLNIVRDIGCRTNCWALQPDLSEIGRCRKPRWWSYHDVNGPVFNEIISHRKPIHNSFVDSNNGRHHDELLIEIRFSTHGEARNKICAWQNAYNYHRRHSRLGNIPPAEIMGETGLEMRAA